MQSIHSYSFQNKKALVRVDFNVPLENSTFEITDDTRIKAAVPTINKILSAGGSVILMTHLGRPKNGPDEASSLRHILKRIEDVCETKVSFSKSCIGKEAEVACSKLKFGEILVLENVRFFKEETNGDRAFAQYLAKLGDCYVNDAFGTAHRAHASTAIIADFFPNDKMFGLLMEREILNIDKVLCSSEAPKTAIVGGAKVSSKITIIENLLSKMNSIIIGGGMAYTFIKAQGGKIGSSLVEDDYLQTALNILEKAKQSGVEIILPIDTIIADSFSNNAKRKEVKISEIPDGWMGLDTGKESKILFDTVLSNSKIILWNGPMGVFEFTNFQSGTKQIAKSIVNTTQKGAFSLVGGGDSVAAVNKFGFADKVSYVSTGGGAMLEYLEGIDLPGIKAIRN
ncbi:MAG: phosphoglycerate kinase [Bacteroidota bacterium]